MYRYIAEKSDNVTFDEFERIIEEYCLLIESQKNYVVDECLFGYIDLGKFCCIITFVERENYYNLSSINL
jgi:hypothetical protein